MSYSVQLSNGARRTGLASSTACVLFHAGVSSHIGPFDHLVLASGVFQIYKPGYSQAFGSIALTQETLASAAAGAQVLIDDGTSTSTWRLGTVTGDGTSSVGPGGVPIPASTAAAVPIGDNSQSAPAVGEKLTLLGTASDGTMCFQTSKQQMLFCSAVATVGAIPGQLAAVNVPGAGWQVVQL